MTGLIETLYAYALEHLTAPYLSQEKEYHDTASYSQRLEEDFRSILNDEQLKQFEALQSEDSQLSFFEQKAMFRAGLHIALELSR